MHLDLLPERYSILKTCFLASLSVVSRNVLLMSSSEEDTSKRPQNQNQNSLLVKRQNDNTSSTHQSVLNRSKLSNLDENSPPRNSFDSLRANL